MALALMAGCGGLRTQSTSGGCPGAMAIDLAQWAAPRPPDDSGKTAPAWLVRLGHRVPGPDAPEPGPLPAYVVAKLGLGPLPPTVWLLRAGERACRGQIAGYVAELVDDGPRSIMISAVLTGCPGAAESYARGWVSLDEHEPLGCEVRLPEAVGERVGETSEAGFTVAPETDASRLPDAWQDATPEGACDAPCETLWSIATVPGEPALHAVLVSEVVPNADACMVDDRSAFGLYATTPDGAQHLLRGPTVDASGWAPLTYTTLAGALHDGAGNRVVLAVGLDDWSAYDLAADGSLGAGRTVQFFVAHEEDSLHLSLAPDCGP